MDDTTRDTLPIARVKFMCDGIVVEYQDGRKTEPLPLTALNGFALHQDEWDALVEAIRTPNRFIVVV